MIGRPGDSASRVLDFSVTKPDLLSLNNTAILPSIDLRFRDFGVTPLDLSTIPLTAVSWRCSPAGREEGTETT